MKFAKPILSLITHNAYYQFLLYEKKAIISIPLSMYENGKVPFNNKDLVSINVNNNTIDIVYSVPPELSISKNISIKDIE